MSFLKSIWLSPRATISKIVENNPGHLFYFLSPIPLSIAGISWAMAGQGSGAGRGWKGASIFHRLAEADILSASSYGLGKNDACVWYCSVTGTCCWLWFGGRWFGESLKARAKFFRIPNTKICSVFNPHTGVEPERGDRCEI